MQYHGDRFYLNSQDTHRNLHSSRRDGRGWSDFTHTLIATTSERNQLQDYYFDRKEYFERVKEKEGIDGVIISTYRLELEALASEFPSLFKPEYAIPTLILHGEKGRNYHLLYGDVAPTRTNHMKFEDLVLKEENEEYNISTPTKSNSINPEAKFHQHFRDLRIPSSMSIYEVTPTFYQDNTGARRTVFALGVHHPKYIMIFTRKGMHFIITTANFTENKSIDASWVEYFPRTSCHSTESTEFGMVLIDFLQKQSMQIRKEIEDDKGFIDGDTIDQDFSIFDWISQKTGIDDLEDVFDFSKASVKLVSTVPSRYPLPLLSKTDIDALYHQQQLAGETRALEKCHKCKAEEAKLLPEDNIKYGSLRIEEILTSRYNRWPRPFTAEDTIFVQPTSIGQNINIAYIDQYLSHLMPEKDWEESTDPNIRNEHWKCLWPSHQYMKEIHHRLFAIDEEEQQHLELHATEDIFANTIEQKPFISGPPEILFFHPKSFALMEPDIQAQFYTYQTNDNLVKEHKIPHIKSYTRLYAPTASNANAEKKCRCYEIAWMLLTSACLSKGAQGELKPYSICKDCKHLRRGYWEYRNFELGVMFKSSKHQQYYAISETCPLHPNFLSSSFSYSQLHSHNSPSSIRKKQEIFLPYPYDLLKAQSYCDDRLRLQRMPFFRPMQDIYKFLTSLAQEQALKEIVLDTTANRNEYGRRIFRLEEAEPEPEEVEEVVAAPTNSSAITDRYRRPPTTERKAAADEDGRMVIDLSESIPEVPKFFEGLGGSLFANRGDSPLVRSQARYLPDSPVKAPVKAPKPIMSTSTVTFEEPLLTFEEINDDINESKIAESLPVAFVPTEKKVSPNSQRKSFIRQIRADTSEDSESTNVETPAKRRRVQKISHLFHPTIQSAAANPLPVAGLSLYPPSQTPAAAASPLVLSPFRGGDENINLSQSTNLLRKSSSYPPSKVLEVELNELREQKKKRFERKRPHILDEIDSPI